MPKKKEHKEELENKNMPEPAEEASVTEKVSAIEEAPAADEEAAVNEAPAVEESAEEAPAESGDVENAEKTDVKAKVGGFFAKIKSKTSEKADALKGKFSRKDKAEEKHTETAEDPEVEDEYEYEEYEAHDEAPEQVPAKSSGKIIRRNTTHGFGCLGGILYFLFIACVSIVLGSLLWMFASDMLGMGMESGADVQIVVPENFTIDSVTDTLYEEGIISYKFLFKFYADLSGAEEKIVAGAYEINTESDYRSVVNTMKAKKAVRDVVKVTIPEGWSMYQIFEKLEEDGVCTAEELWEAATNYPFKKDFIILELGNKHRLEGFLFPDTYNFYIDDTPENVISKFLDNFAVKWSVDYTARGNELGYNLEEILAIASIIEKEAGRVSEMGSVSSVIYNRLRSGMTLGMESTLAYIVQGTDQKPAEVTGVENPYNTYKYKGLPAGPIANPGTDAIYAALYPESTSYYYFALGKDGLTHFFNNYNQFLAFTKSAEYGGE